ncbi:hypothetical protein QWY85_04245 [Neolewinella lacunae]|uniref:Uncharacterized protein n=1 Tax=Neolewinella lacunae TaxID=1517758 RepID=A0A923T6T1_9BACT|nr:hypothetical protein [Neolewinella lacunae]MBC6992829.1 hypothetical protein [Neolewinella lacunae]MDN3633856.1 hypothetical protein [Neolewinella lacunae]
MLFTAIGTVSHEYGHIAVANFFGYETTLHYGSMNYFPAGYLQDDDLKSLRSLTKDFAGTEYDLWPEEIKEKAKAYNNILQNRYWNAQTNNALYVTMGGPLQTIFTGALGLIILVLRKNSIHQNGLKILDWLAVFLGLFWLREIFNLAASIGGEIILPDGSWFAGDEYHISQALNLWEGTVPIALGILGMTASFYIVFKIIPQKLQLTFVLSGMLGGIMGYVLWMHIIGPKILP